MEIKDYYKENYEREQRIIKERQRKKDFEEKMEENLLLWSFVVVPLLGGLIGINIL